jgi:hypothetical protein
LSDLSKYSEKLVDGGVVAYPVSHTKPRRFQDKRDMEIEITAEVLKLNEGEDAEEADEKVEEKVAEKVEKKAEKVEEKDEL